MSDENRIPELTAEALDDLCRYLGEYGWNAAFAARILYRRHGVKLAPLDAQYLYAVELRRREHVARFPGRKGPTSV